MASTVTIDAPLIGKSGTNIRGKAQKISGASKGNQTEPFQNVVYRTFFDIAGCFQELQDQVDRVGEALRREPSASRIEIDSADILDLIVGGRDGPGQLTILSGPPNYTRIGWDGTESSGVSVAITSVSGDTVNTATAHGLVEDDIVLIAEVSSINHLGYWIVDTTPTPTSYTLVDPPAGTGTGGTSTLQFAGGWRRDFAIGGTGFTDAPFFSKHGVVIIGKNGSVSLQDSFQVQKGYIGVTTPEAPKTVTGTADNGGLVRLTVTAHGFENGDTVIAGSAGYAVTVIDANTIDLIGSVFGTFTPVATVSRYFAGIWDEQHASGGTGFEDAPFRAKADGSIRIGDPSLPHFEVAADGSILIGATAGPRLEISSSGDMSITDADISITSGSSTITLDTTDGLVIQVGTQSATLSSGYLQLEDSGAAGRTGIYDMEAWLITHGPSEATMSGLVSALGSFFEMKNSAGLAKFSMSTVTEVLTAPVLFVTDAATTRTNLDVYSKAEVDALVPDVSNYYTKAEIDAFLFNIDTQLAFKSNVGHTHNTISITSTTGTVAHTHTGNVS